MLPALLASTLLGDYPPPPVPRQMGHVVGTVAVGDPKCGPQKNECPLALPSVSAEMIQFRGMLSAA